jgi:hypothetical protein
MCWCWWWAIKCNRDHCSRARFEVPRERGVDVVNADASINLNNCRFQSQRQPRSRCWMFVWLAFYGCGIGLRSLYVREQALGGSNIASSTVSAINVVDGGGF